MLHLKSDSQKDVRYHIFHRYFLLQQPSLEYSLLDSI